MDTLDLDVVFYHQQALSQSTQRTYRSALHSYNIFCAQVGTSAFPLSERLLQYYSASIARRLTYLSIKTYLMALQYFSRIFGFNTEISNMHQLFYLLRGIRRSQSSIPRPRRAPITIQHLDTLFEYVESHFIPTDAYMLQAAFSLSFYALLRVSEFTAPRIHHFNSYQTLMRSDVSSVSKEMFKVYIKQSKTDVFRAGCHLRIAATNTRHCPVLTMQRWLTIHPANYMPLFIYYDGSFLTRPRLSYILSSCFRDTSINTHSFRIGGASLAASNGIPDSTIQILGRWSSDAFLRYLHYDDRAIQAFYRQMSRSNSLNTVWHFSEPVDRIHLFRS